MDPGEAIGLLMTREGRIDPYPTYHALREHGPLIRLDERFYVAVGYAVLGDALRDPRMLVPDTEFARTAFPDWALGPANATILTSMLQTNPPDHSRMRRLAAGTFTPRRIELMREAITAQARTLVDFLAHLFGSGAEVDFMAEFAAPLPVRLICTLLGVPTPDQPWVREQADALAVVVEQNFGQGELEAADRAAVELSRYFTELVGQRRRDPRDDLTTALVQAHDGDGSTLAGDELLANLILLLLAGFETTTNLLGNGLMALLARPELAGALRADPGLADGYVAEVLRFDSPVQVTSRWCRDETGFGGHTLPGGTQLLLLLGAGNRDPERFAGPDEFDPARPANQSLSFGAGPHYCLGAPLARLEAQIAFPMLLRRFPGLVLAGEATRRDRLTLRGYATMPLATNG